MATEKETIILDLQVDQGSAISELEKTKKSIIQLKQEQKELTEAYKKGNVTLDEYASESVRLESILKKQQSTYNNVQKSVTGVKTQLDKLIDSNKKISEEFKNAAASINIAGVSIGDLTNKISSLASPTTAAVALVGALATAYAKSGKGADDLANATNNLTAGLDAFINRIGNASDGDFFDKLTRKLNIALINLTNNSKAAADAEKQRVRIAEIELKTLRELELERIEAQGRQKDREREAEKARRERDNSELSYQERLNAVERVKENIQGIDTETVGILQRQINALISYGENTGKIVNGQINDRELNIQILNLKNEIADKQEEVTGKLTENIMAEKAILKEQKDKTAELQKQSTLLNEQKQLEKDRADFKKKEAEAAKKQAEREANVGTRQLGQLGTDPKKVELKEVQQTEKQKQDAYLETAQFKQMLDTETAAVTIEQLGRAAQAFGDQTALGKLLGIADATVNTYVGATQALDYPFPANLLAFAATVATGLKAVGTISGVAAAGGADFVTNRPTMLLVGDNPGGRERVTVEPLSGKGNTKVFNGGRMIAAAGGLGNIDGGASKNSAVRETNQALLYANAIKNMPKPVVGWAEGKRVRDRVEFKEKVTRL